jgi:hypothetical protein
VLGHRVLRQVIDVLGELEQPRLRLIVHPTGPTPVSLP